MEGLEILVRGEIFIGWWKSVEEWFWLFKPFSKLKAIFCKNWTSTKLKLAWPVCTKVWSYENGTEATSTAKIEGFIGYKMEIVI